jgi:hypothetical protein
MLAFFTLVSGEGLPSWNNTRWAAAAGLSGAVGIAALYRGLATGHAAQVAPVTAVISAVIPVAVGSWIQGWPRVWQIAGFGAALPGVRLVSLSPLAEENEASNAFGLACMAGLGFGGFLTLIARVETGPVFAPLVVARTVSPVCKHSARLGVRPAPAYGASSRHRVPGRLSGCGRQRPLLVGNAVHAVGRSRGAVFHVSIDNGRSIVLAAVSAGDACPVVRCRVVHGGRRPHDSVGLVWRVLASTQVLQPLIWLARRWTPSVVDGTPPFSVADCGACMACLALGSPPDARLAQRGGSRRLPQPHRFPEVKRPEP